MSINQKRELLQTIGTTAAFFISMLALIVSIYEADLLKTQQKAMVWPYLRIQENYNNEGFGLTATNNGTGPAVITSVEISYDEKPVKNYAELVAKMFPEEGIGYDVIKTGIINETVITNNERRQLFFIPWNEGIRKEFENLKSLNIKIGYQSVLEENWLYEYPSGERSKIKFKAKMEFEN